MLDKNQLIKGKGSETWFILIKANKAYVIPATKTRLRQRLKID